MITFTLAPWVTSCEELLGTGIRILELTCLTVVVTVVDEEVEEVEEEDVLIEVDVVLDKLGLLTMRWPILQSSSVKLTWKWSNIEFGGIITGGRVVVTTGMVTVTGAVVTAGVVIGPVVVVEVVEAEDVEEEEVLIEVDVLLEKLGLLTMKWSILQSSSVKLTWKWSNIEFGGIMTGGRVVVTTGMVTVWAWTHWIKARNTSMAAATAEKSKKLRLPMQSL